jgi:choline dehydrogenase-like flavoprotein
VDGSVTPTSLGVNPQLTILAIAEKSADWIAENFRRLG